MRSTAAKSKMEIIDAHAHIYPEKIAAKATDTIGIFYDIKMEMPPVGRPKGINTLLGVAASQNQGPIVQYLLEQKLYGVDDRVTDDSKTALICAVEERAYDACEALLKCNADKTLQDAHGKTAMDYALELNDEKLISMLNE